MGLMDWYFNNIERASQARTSGALNARAEMAQQNAPQVRELMGYNTMQTGADGLTTGMSSGIMGMDQNDPQTFLQMGTGLMAIPGYQQAGQQVLGQAVANQLGRAGEAARLAETRRYNDARLDMQLQAAQQARQGMIGPYKDMSQYMTAAGGLRDDARAELEPFRQQMSLYNTVQDLVGEKGFHGMSIADDELFIKSYAKMLLPNEAVMTDDISRIATSDKLDSVIRGMANKVGYGVELGKEEREALWQSMYRTASSAAPRYEQLRDDYTQRAIRSYLNPADILNTAITMDSRNFAGTATGKVTDTATIEALDEKAKEQDGGSWWPF